MDVVTSAAGLTIVSRFVELNESSINSDLSGIELALDSDEHLLPLSLDIEGNLLVDLITAGNTGLANVGEVLEASNPTVVNGGGDIASNGLDGLLRHQVTCSESIPLFSTEVYGDVFLDVVVSPHVIGVGLWGCWFGSNALFNGES